MTNTAGPARGRRRNALAGPVPASIPVVVAGLAAALLAGCGGGETAPRVVSIGSGSPVAGASGTAADRDGQIARYRDCLVTGGVTLLDQPTEEGMPQIDKESTNLAVINSAAETCRPLLQAVLDAQRPDPQAVEEQRRLAACVRGHGLPEYPDPDPVTGDSRVSDQLAARIKVDPDLLADVEDCQRQVRPASTGGTIGG